MVFPKLFLETVDIRRESIGHRETANYLSTLCRVFLCYVTNLMAVFSKSVIVFAQAILSLHVDVHLLHLWVKVGSIDTLPFASSQVKLP